MAGDTKSRCADTPAAVGAPPPQASSSLGISTPGPEGYSGQPSSVEGGFQLPLPWTSPPARGADSGCEGLKTEVTSNRKGQGSGNVKSGPQVTWLVLSYILNTPGAFRLPPTSLAFSSGLSHLLRPHTVSGHLSSRCYGLKDAPRSKTVKMEGEWACSNQEIHYYLC